MTDPILNQVARIQSREISKTVDLSEARAGRPVLGDPDIRVRVRPEDPTIQSSGFFIETGTESSGWIDFWGRLRVSPTAQVKFTVPRIGMPN